MKKLWFKFKSWFLTLFGNIKYYKYPFFLIYDPNDYKIDGEKIRTIVKKIRPGDLILRKYCDYLDGIFIPGKYSHTGIYIGEGKIIHAVAEGVSLIDIYDFIKCDYICVLRPVSGQKEAIEIAKKQLDKPYDFNFEDGDGSLYCHELGALCYKQLNIERKTATLLNGLIKARKKKWLAESFIESPDFKVIVEF